MAGFFVSCWDGMGWDFVAFFFSPGVFFLLACQEVGNDLVVYCKNAIFFVVTVDCYRKIANFFFGCLNQDPLLSSVLTLSLSVSNLQSQSGALDWTEEQSIRASPPAGKESAAVILVSSDVQHGDGARCCSSVLVV